VFPCVSEVNQELYDKEYWVGYLILLNSCIDNRSEYMYFNVERPYERLAYLLSLYCVRFENLVWVMTKVLGSNWYVACIFVYNYSWWLYKALC